VLVATGAIAPLVAGCGSAQRFDGHAYRGASVSLDVPSVPGEWRRVDVAAADLAFRDDAREGSILIDGRCGRRDEDVPLTSLTQQLIMGTTGREFVSEETIPFDGREALHSVLRAKLDGVEMQYDVYVLKKDGCVYDFVYVAPPARFADGAPVFERFATGIHVRAAGS
jgi:hypothetical protein